MDIVVDLRPSLWQSPWPTWSNEHTGDHVDNLRAIIGCANLPKLLAKFQKDLGDSYDDRFKKKLKIIVACETGDKHSVAIATILRHFLSNRKLESNVHVRHWGPPSDMKKKHLKECAACKNPSKQAEYDDLLGKALAICQKVMYSL